VYTLVYNFRLQKHKLKSNPKFWKIFQNSNYRLWGCPVGLSKFGTKMPTSNMCSG